MKLKALVLGAVAALALFSARPAAAFVPAQVDVYEDGTDMLLPFSVVGEGYVVMMEHASDNLYDTSNWSDLANFFNVGQPVSLLPVLPSGAYVHLYSTDAGPAQADLGAFLPAVQSRTNTVFLVEDASGVTNYSVGDRLYKFHEPVSATPEPASSATAAFGLAGLGLLALARRRA